MSDGTETSAEVAQPAGDELADLMAGYNAGAAEQAPPAVNQEASEKPGDVDPETAQTAAPEGSSEHSSTEEQQTAAPSIEDRLAELKAEVRAIAPGNDAAVRKLYGEIGAINRTLQEMKPKAAPAPAPVDDELTAALKDVDQAAEDFPELSAPIANAIKAVAKKVNSFQPSGQQGQALSQEQIDATIAARLEEQRRRDAEEALVIDHPDFNTVIRSPQFEAWVNAKPADQQATIRNTQNPLLASRFLSDFKASQQVKQQKQSRLAAAVTPTGVAKPAAPSKLSAEEEILLGYQKAGPRPLHKR